jgi:hypothetical protein
MSKDQIEILDYFFNDYDFVVEFSINNEEGYRILEISEDEIYDFLNDEDYLEMFSDEWDYSTESHYTKHWRISVDEYLTEHFCSDDVLEFLHIYFKDHDYPKLEREEI